MRIIRKLTGADADACRALRLESLRLYPDYFGAAAEEEGAEPLIFFRERLEYGVTFGAFDEDRLCGLVSCVQQIGAKRRHKGTLVGMYVQPARQGTGVAGALVDAVVAHAAPLVELLQLSVAETNLRARRFYERKGFVAYGAERKALKIGDAYVDEILMWRSL